jgi:HlyD family secretion protein
MKRFIIIIILSTSFIISSFSVISCSNHTLNADATGIFEAVETVISSEVSGVIKQFSIQEGDEIEAGKTVAIIDTTPFYLQKLQLLSKKQSLLAGCPDKNKQLAPVREEIIRLQKEKARTENLFLGGAATRQQLDDITAQLNITESKLIASQNSLQMTIETINKECITIDIQIALIDDQLKKCHIINPLSGRVLKKYTEVYEIASPVKALYRIADMEQMFLRAYITSAQLSGIKLGQQVKVYSDYGNDGKREYNGTVTWISDKAEFTPKTIQTKDERENLVYAIKIAVNNDGYLKTGQYGELYLAH